MAERSAKQLGLSQADLPNSVLEVISTLSKSGFEAYLVGGGVRDTLLGLNPKDFDAVTDAKPHEIKDLFGKRCRIIGRRFQLAHVYSGRDMIEVATFRAPPRGNAHTNSDGMIVRDNVWGDIKQDFARRDFTINALYYQPIKGIVHDFCDALGDIKSKTLSLLGDAPVRIEEDPVRLLRALRFKAKLGFEFDKALAQQFNDKNWALLDQVSPHRLYDESQKMFTGGYLVPLLPLLFEYGAIDHLFIYPPKQPTALVNQVAINTDKRIAVGKSINPAFFYAALLWDNYLYQLAKFKKKKIPFQDAQLKAAAKVIDRQRIKTAIPRFAEQFIRDIWMLQPKLANPRVKQIHQLAEHPRFRAGFDFLLLREQCNDADNPLSESTNGMGAWWQNYQTLSEKQKQQAISDFNDDSQDGSRRGRNRKRKSGNDVGTNNDSLNDSDDKSQDKSQSDSNSQSSSNSPVKDKNQHADNASKSQKNSGKQEKPKTTANKNKRNMSRPQRAHYNREREQLLKLSLNTAEVSDSKNTVDAKNAEQPKPLFTLDADKLAKQLPAGFVDQLMGQENKNQDVKNQNIKDQQAKQRKESAVESDLNINDKVNHTAAQQPQTKPSAKSPDNDKPSADNSSNKSAKPTNKRRAQEHSATKNAPVPSRRRRREPSSTVTQVELKAQKLDLESTDKTDDKSVKPSNATVSKTDKLNNKSVEKSSVETSNENKQLPTIETDTVSPVRRGRIPSIRRRRQPSSTMSVKERLAASS